MQAPKTIVYLRADGDSKTGLGHVHRLLALAEILSDFYDCKFIIQSPLPGISTLISKSCTEIIKIDDATKKEDEFSGLLTGNEIVVLDGYSFGTAYQQSIKDKGNILLSIDDLHQYHFVSDAIINPAGNVNESQYSISRSTKLFLGPAYSLLKKPFLEAARTRSKKISNNAIFICMGGADPENHTLITLQSCLEFNFSSYYIVIGEAFSHKEELFKIINASSHNINVLSNLESTKLVHVMKNCPVAVCSASGIAYEYLCVGGELYIKQTAKNQKDLYNYLINTKLANSFNDFRVDESEVHRSLQMQIEIFDGHSDRRIRNIFNRLDFNHHVSIRKANVSDLMIVFNWVNDLELRKQSHNSNLITIEDHSNWFHAKINDPKTFFYILEYKNIPLGQVRLDCVAEVIISYSIDQSFRGRGWGQMVLEKSIEEFKKEAKGFPINMIGFVKKTNRSSNTIFKNLKFTQNISGQFPDSYRYELLIHD